MDTGDWGIGRARPTAAPRSDTVSVKIAVPFYQKLWLGLALLSALLSSASVARAVPADEQAFTEMTLNDLLELEVFSAASKVPTQYTKAPGTVYSFNREDFLRLGVRRVDELMAFVPGFQLNQYRKRHRSIWSRGLLNRYNDKMVLLVDGVRMSHLYYEHFALGDNFPLEKVERVEVIIGPASSLYGANAFGGIIAITTRAFAEAGAPQVEATVEAGNHKRLKGTLLANTEKFQGFASYLTQDAPFSDDRKSFIGGQTLQPLDEDYSNLFLKARPLPGLTLMLDYYRNDTPFLFIPDTQDAFVEERPLTLAASYELGDLDQGRIEADLHYTRDHAKEYEKEQQTQGLGYQEKQDATTAGATITGFKRLFDDHVFALGAAWQHERADNMDLTRYFRFDRGFLDPPITGSLLSQPNIKNNDYGVYAQDVWTINPEFNLTLGGRYDQFDQFGGYFNYRAALVYTPDQRQTWKLLYGTAIRTPSFREYLKVLEGTDFEAPTPDPERIKSLELGYLYQWDQANLSVTLFHNRVEDTIQEVPTPDGQDEYFANSGDPWRLRGIETLLQWRPLADLDLRLSGSYLDAEVKGDGDLPYQASWSGTFNVNYRVFKAHRVGLSLIYNSERQDTNDYQDDDPTSFVLANLFASGRISKNLSYAAGVDNLFDKRVYDPAADFGGQHNTERSERAYWLRLKWGFSP